MKSAVKKLKANNRLVKKTGGGVRKKANKRAVKKQANQEKETKEFKSLMTNINNSIELAEKDGNAKLVNDYILQYLIIIYCSLRQFSIDRKSKTFKTIKILRRDWNKILDLLFYKSRFKSNIKFYRQNLTENGFKYIQACYNSLYNDLLAQAYKTDLDNYMSPPEDELKLHMTRFGFSDDRKLEEIRKEELYDSYLEKTLEYHPDTTEGMKNPEKYKILTARIKKAFIALDLQIDHLKRSS